MCEGGGEAHPLKSQWDAAQGRIDSPADELPGRQTPAAKWHLVPAASQDGARPGLVSPIL